MGGSETAITELSAAFFHFLCLSRRFIEPRLKIRPAIIPSHLDSLFPIAGQNDELKAGLF
jgi:hypothetical protein